MIWLNTMVSLKPGGCVIAMCTMRALSVSWVSMPNEVMAVFSDTRCRRYKTRIASVVAQTIADMVYSIVLPRPTSPMKCIGTPAKITDELSTKKVIRHKRSCQLWLRRSRKTRSRGVISNLMIFHSFYHTKVVHFYWFYPFLPSFLPPPLRQFTAARLLLLGDCGLILQPIEQQKTNKYDEDF